MLVQGIPKQRGPRKWKGGEMATDENIEMDANKIPRLVVSTYSDSELNHD